MKYVTHSAAVSAPKSPVNSAAMGFLASTGGSTDTKVSSPAKRWPVARPSTVATRAAGAPRSASSRADSGRKASIGGTRASGAAPPSSITERQPLSGMRYPAAKPISAEPSVKPENMAVIIRARHRAGAYSLSSVVAFGMAAPMPMPARKRSAAISSGVEVKAAASVSSAKASTDAISTGLRPKRSEDGPASSAPNTRPKGAALMTKPNTARDTLQSCRIGGVTKPMMATSMPSAMTTRKHSATSSHCRGAMGPPSMKPSMSTVRATFRFPQHPSPSRSSTGVIDQDATPSPARSFASSSPGPPCSGGKGGVPWV